MFWKTIKHLKETVGSLIAELDEAEETANTYRLNWINEHDRVKELESQLESKEQILRMEEMKNARLTGLYMDMSKQVMEVKPENAILRQILEDLTGKPVEDLLEAHKRAVRTLEYGVTVPALSETQEEK